MKRTRGFWLVGLLLPLTLFAAAPDISLRDVDGNTHEVNEYIGRGRWTVVAVWSVDCVICQRELPEVAFFHDAHKNKDAIVLGVSVDGIAERVRVRKFIDDNELGFPNLIGERADVAKFGGGSLRGTPTYLIFLPDGRLAARHVGASAPDYLDRELARLKKQQGNSVR